MARRRNHYVIDTCSLTQMRRVYPKEVFPSVWEFVGELVAGQVVQSIELVYDELTPQSDDVKAWADERKEMFVPLDEPIQVEANKILTQFPDNFLDLKKRKSGADPFIVAAGAIWGSVVVTEEGKSGGPPKVKIPDVCAKRGVECIPLLELLRREGFSL